MEMFYFLFNYMFFCVLCACQIYLLLMISFFSVHTLQETPDDPTEWEKLCFYSDAIINRIDLKFKRFEKSEIEVKHLKSDSCHGIIEESDE